MVSHQAGPRVGTVATVLRRREASSSPLSFADARRNGSGALILGREPTTASSTPSPGSTLFMVKTKKGKLCEY